MLYRISALVVPVIASKFDVALCDDSTGRGLTDLKKADDAATTASLADFFWRSSTSTKLLILASATAGSAFTIATTMTIQRLIRRYMSTQSPKHSCNANSIAAMSLSSSEQSLKATRKYRYPYARRDKDSYEAYHGVIVADPYRHLEDVHAYETQRWIAAQQKLTESYLSESNSAVRESIYTSLKAMKNYMRVTCPFKEGNYYYLFKNDGLQNQFVLYQCAGSWEDAASFVKDGNSSNVKTFLDMNAESEDGTSAMRTCSFSESGKYFAFGVSHKGSDWMSIRIRKTSDGVDLKNKSHFGADTSSSSLEEVPWVRQYSPIVYSIRWS